MSDYLRVHSNILLAFCLSVLYVEGRLEMEISSVSNWARVGGKWTRYTLTRARRSDSSSSLPSEAAKLQTFLVLPGAFCLYFLQQKLPSFKGNPGNDNFYTDFAEALAENVRGESNVYTLAHLNHVPLPSGLATLDKQQASREQTAVAACKTQILKV